MIKAVHYFSNAWAGNFWSGFHPKRVSAEFEQIKADGFNTIILLLPWRGFQYDIEKSELNQEYLQRLRFLLKAATQIELKVMLRVSYPHYSCPHSIGAPRLRVERILREPEIKQQWFLFLSQIGNLAIKYSSFEYAFISWEDFWHIFTLFQQRGPNQRKEIAKDLKYDEYINNSVGLSSYNAMGLEGEDLHKTLDDIEIPVLESPRYRFYLDFINHHLNEILGQARDYISPLIMEVRVDKDSYVDNEGKTHWYDNDLQLYSQLPRLSYWAPFIGAENKGEKLSADQALETFSHTLEKITNFDHNTQHIINQFNFIDETPAFKGVHAEIAEEELPQFMQGAAQLLQSRSIGYGLWAYRDYYQNLLYNPAMARGIMGWNALSKGVKFPSSAKKGRFLLLKKGAALEQNFCFSERGVGKLWLDNWNKIYFSLETDPNPFYRAPSIAGLELTFAGRAAKAMQITKGRVTGFFDITDITNPHESYSFKICSTTGQVRISMVYLYFYEFKNHIYNSLGEPDKHRNLIVQFNHALATDTDSLNTDSAETNE